jgi:hypothetical protein
MGFKIKSVPSVHNYSRSKKWELFVNILRISINLFSNPLMRHPILLRVMRQETPRRRKLQQLQWQLVRTQLLQR